MYAVNHPISWLREPDSNRRNPVKETGYEPGEKPLLDPAIILVPDEGIKPSILLRVKEHGPSGRVSGIFVLLASGLKPAWFKRCASPIDF